MQQIAIKELVEFRRRSSDASKKRLAYKLKHRKAKEKKDMDENEGGGNYWVTSTSCIYNVFKHGKDEFYDLKIKDLQSKFEEAKVKRIKTMHQRNMDILTSFKDFQFDDIRPLNISKFETVHKVHKIIPIDDFPLYLNPSLVFSHDRNGKNEVGALWLGPQLNGIKKAE